MNNADLQVYLITDEHTLNVHNRDFFEAVEEAIKGGVTMVQIREKNLSLESFKEKAAKLKELTEKYNVPLIINDEAEVFIDSNTEGLHVGQSDLEQINIFKTLGGKGSILGITANSVEDAKTAEKMGADYIGVGAVFQTSTKDDAKPLSIEELKEIVKSVNIPVVAIGGITVDNVHLLKGIGLSGVAVSSGILSATSIFDSAKAFKETLL